MGARSGFSFVHTAKFRAGDCTDGSQVGLRYASEGGALLIRPRGTLGLVFGTGHSPRHSDTDVRLRQGAAIEKKISNLTAALAEGYRSPAILADLARFEAELQEIRELSAASRPEAITLRMTDMRRFVESRLTELRTLFGAEAVEIRAEISKHVQKITLTPEGRSYVASGTWDVLGVNPWMVPGARIARDVYSPSAFHWLLDWCSGKLYGTPTPQ